MAYNPPIKNRAWVAPITLQDIAVAGSFKANPTIAAGDFQISKDFGAFANLTNLPAVSPAASVSVQISLTATEMNASNVMVVGIDQTASKEWCDFSLTLNPTAG